MGVNTKFSWEVHLSWEKIRLYSLWVTNKHFCQFSEGSAVMNDENTDETHGCSKVRTGTQNEAALLALMEKTGYNMVQENGQRKFGGPPPGKKLGYHLTT